MNNYAVRVSFMNEKSKIMLYDLRYINAECGIDALILIEDEMESRGFKGILFKGLRDMTNDVWVINGNVIHKTFIKHEWVTFKQLKALSKGVSYGTLNKRI